MPTPRGEALQSLALFAGLSSEDRELLASNLDEMSFAPGITLITQGDINHAFFILVEGEVEVTVSGEPRRTLRQGDFFGEISMGHHIPATASVVTTTDVRAYVMSHAQFRALALVTPVLTRLVAAMNERLLADHRPGSSARESG